MKQISFSMRFSAVAAAIGLLCLGVAALLATASRVEARDLGPEVTGGTQPYVSFTGQVPVGNTTIYTVPNDRILVVTGASMSVFSSLYQGITPKVLGGASVMTATATSTPILRAGNGHVVFDPGSTLVINCSTSGPDTYFIQGYLAHP